MKGRRFTDRRTWADAVLESKNGAIIAGIIAIVFGVFFALTTCINDPITRSEAVAYSGVFQEYEVWDNSRTIIFADGSSYEVYPHTETEEFASAMEALPKGTRLSILVNPNSGYAVEIKAGARELLNFEESQAAIDKYDNGYIGIGIFVCFLGVFLIVYGIISSKQREIETKRQKKKLKRSASGAEDLPLRNADRTVKAKILLKARAEDYEICYRRIKSVNELVINGVVYDEIKGVMEFSHNLSAVVDGHTIEAGLSEDCYSYIMFVTVNALQTSSV